ncbi:hypothetical protein ACS0TY_017017 [Phlomoides rotata]
MTATWLSERFIQKFQSDGNRDVNGFMLDAMHDVRCEVSKNQAYRAKIMTLSKIEGDVDLQYTKLWSYAGELRKTNFGSTIILGTTDDNRFDRFYVCWNAMKRDFLSGCRPIVGVDGCFLKSKYGGNLLTTVGVDGNNNLFPVAYDVVDKENGEIWEWFFTILKKGLEINAEDFTFISDKQKGLIQAFHSVFPGAEHRFYVRHLHNNLKSAGFNGLAYNQILWKAAMSTTKGEFKSRMEEMKGLNLAAWEWFSNKPPEQWSKAYFSDNSKCDMLLNNVCESFNSNILLARDKAVITMLEWIREYLMQRLQKNRDIALVKWRGQLCPRIQKIIEINTEKVSDCIPIKGNDIHYQVSCFDGRQFTVDLSKNICSCRSWQLTGIPCPHGICAILRQGLDPVAFVDECYTVRKYVKAYELPIYGISHDQLWGDTLYIPPLPPNFGTRPARGRNTKKKGWKRMKRTQRARAKTRLGGEDSRPLSNAVVLYPPRTRNQMANEDLVDEQHNDTQQSTTTNVTWNQPAPQPQQGPSQHDQLELGQPVASRVQMRRPPRFGEGHFSRTQFVAPQQTVKKKVFVEGGQKYMNLSKSSSKAMKGKKKQACSS